MTRLRAHPPAGLAGLPVTGTIDLAAGPGATGPGAEATGPGDGTGGLPPSDVLTYHLPGARVVIRPSGTEPKLKAYLEVVEPVAGRPLAEARAAATARLAPLREAVTALVSAGHS
jgi:phosphomannomutase